MGIVVLSDNTFWRIYVVKIIPLRAFAALAIVAAFTGFTNLAQAGREALPPPIPSALLFESISTDGLSLQYILQNTTPIVEDHPLVLINGFAVEFGLPDIDFEGPVLITFDTTQPAEWTGEVFDTSANALGPDVPGDLFTLPKFVLFETDSDFVAPGESRGLFTLSILIDEVPLDAILASNFIAFCDNGQGGSVPCAEGETTVPEPGALALFGVGLVGFGLMRRRRKMAA
jgi:hypothetical protein